jgi:hypothetical protein
VIFITFEMKYDDLKNSTLCEHGCGVNRLKGETGVCRMTLPQVRRPHSTLPLNSTLSILLIYEINSKFFEALKYWDISISVIY